MKFVFDVFCQWVDGSTGNYNNRSQNLWSVISHIDSVLLVFNLFTCMDGIWIRVKLFAIEVGREIKTDELCVWYKHLSSPLPHPSKLSSLLCISPPHSQPSIYWIFIGPALPSNLLYTSPLQNTIEVNTKKKIFPTVDVLLSHIMRFAVLSHIKWI